MNDGAEVEQRCWTQQQVMKNPGLTGTKANRCDTCGKFASIVYAAVYASNRHEALCKAIASQLWHL